MKNQEESLIRKILYFFIKFLVIFSFAYLFGWNGLKISNYVMDEYNLPWNHYSIQTTPNETVGIVHVDLKSSLEDPTGDLIFVKTSDGKIYSNTLYENDWQLIEQAIDWDNDYLIDCTTDRFGPTDAPIWDTPPVDKVVLDSKGALAERPLSIIVRCYVLFEDGSLEVWVHSDDAGAVLGREFTKLLFPVCGGIIGIVLGIIMIRWWSKKRIVKPLVENEGQS